MYQLQNFCFQKVQLLPNLIDSLLNLCNIFGVDFACAVHPYCYLIDVVGNVADEFVNLVKLFLVQMYDTALENHSPDKVTP